jgi:hypothetical protein
MLLTKHKAILLLRSTLTLSILLGVANPPAFATKNQINVNNTQSANASNISSPVKIAGIVTRRNDFTFEYLGCKKYESQMHCTFKITYVGNGEARDFQINSARVFSALDGNQYDSENTLIGGRYSVNMISGQQTRGVLVFPWSPALRQLSTLEFETNQTSSKILIRYRPRPMQRPIPKPPVNPYVQ